MFTRDEEPGRWWFYFWLITLSVGVWVALSALTVAGVLNV